jgi:predicted phosphodiesterase
MRTSVAVVIVVLAAAVTAQTPAVRFAVLSDQTGGAMPGVYDSVLVEVARMTPDFVVTVGDQIQGYVGSDTTRLRGEYDALFAQYDYAFGDRWRTDEDYLIITPGNHDITDDQAEPLWLECIGPTHFRRDVFGVTIFVLDNSRMSEADGIPAEQFAWLREELASVKVEDPVIVLTHRPYFSEFVWSGEDDQAHDLFVEHGVDAVLAGHWHTYVYEPRDGVQYMVCGSSGGSTAGHGFENGEFFGFVWATVVDGSVSLTPISMGNVHDADMLSWDENNAQYAFRSSGVSVSAFDMTGTSGSVSVTARNTGDLVNTDELAWSVPDNWTVSPVSAPFEASPGDSTISVFELSYTASPFPLPILEAGLVYGRNKRVETSMPLPLARTAACPKVSGIRVDGVLYSDEWKDSHTETALMSEEGGVSEVDTTTFFFAHDKKGVYIAATCVFVAGHPLIAEVTDRDGPVYTEDCVGLFFSPADTVVYQIYVGPNGAVFDGRGFFEGGYVSMDYDWDGEYKVAATRTDGLWSVELFVPYKTIGVRRDIESMRITFRRKQKSLDTAADWTPITFDPADMGILKLTR